MVLPEITGVSGVERSSARGSSSAEDGEDEVTELEAMRVQAAVSDGTVQTPHNDAKEVKQGLVKLRSLCKVLGINYNAKLAEFGIEVEKKRLDEALIFLGVTRDHNFQEMKRISKEMITEWELSRAPFKRMVGFSWILYIEDATNADELSLKNLLSTDWVNKARKKITALKKERDGMVERRYTAKRNKLSDLLRDTHLVNEDIQFSPKKQVEKKEYKSEVRNLKQLIKRVKSLAAMRTQLVPRVQLVRKAVVTDKWPLEDVKVLISNAKSAAWVLETNDEAVRYAGRCVEDVLNSYRAQAITAIATRKEEREKANTVKT